MKFWCVALLVFLANSARAQAPGDTYSNISLEQILDRMTARNEWQDRRLLEFRAQRKFYAANPRFKTDSTMHVQTIFRRPDVMQSTVTSQEGSKLIRSRVFDKILEAENETHEKKAKQQVDITPANYDFRLAGSQECDGRACFHMTISPRRRDKYSLDGEVWVDAEDYSIVRIHGSPAKRPSFWTLHTEIDRRYRKIDGIWLPDRLDSSSNILIAGQSVLSIEYSYESVQTAKNEQ
jgi:hypothetical protein